MSPTHEGVDLYLWGQPRGLLWPYPLICHLLDTSAMAISLWDGYISNGLQKCFATSLGVDAGSARLLSFWAGLHNIGKVTPCFQRMDSDAYENLRGYSEAADGKHRHDFADRVWLSSALKDFGYDARRATSPAFIVAQLLGGHHGRFFPRDPNECRYPPTRLFPELGSGKWDLQREAMLQAVEQIVGSPPPPASIPAECAALVCGIMILADWLGQLSHGPSGLPAGTLQVLPSNLPSCSAMQDFHRHASGQ
ncbi:hypothetical protein HerbRD11066_27850 [Herbidospora sp. RD11066]